MAARVMFMLCSARMRRMQPEKSVYGYGTPWKILFTTASGRFGWSLDFSPEMIPSNVTDFSIEYSPE